MNLDGSNCGAIKEPASVPAKVCPAPIAPHARAFGVREIQYQSGPTISTTMVAPKCSLSLVWVRRCRELPCESGPAAKRQPPRERATRREHIPWASCDVQADHWPKWRGKPPLDPGVNRWRASQKMVSPMRFDPTRTRSVGKAERGVVAARRGSCGLVLGRPRNNPHSLETPRPKIVAPRCSHRRRAPSTSTQPQAPRPDPN